VAIRFPPVVLDLSVRIFDLSLRILDFAVRIFDPPIGIFKALPAICDEIRHGLRQAQLKVLQQDDI
jgi:hypothetical protein